jgi:transcriptional regulator with XRE-family HTH domain
MSERSNLIHRLLESVDSRTSYIKAKLGVLVPSQIRSLRLQSEMPRQADLAETAGLHQSRISMFETPGAANMTLETLARLAAAFKVGLVVKFVPFSDMLAWESGFSQDSFTVVKIDKDQDFLNPPLRPTAEMQNQVAQHDFPQMVLVRSAGLAGLNDSAFLALGKISVDEKKGAGVAA